MDPQGGCHGAEAALGSEPCRVSWGVPQLAVPVSWHPGALSPAASQSLVLMVQFCCCSLLQPDVGLRKGPAAVKRSRSRSEPPGRAAATKPLPSLCWWVPTMEEMVIWEQHTVTLSKVSRSWGGPTVGGDGVCGVNSA